MRFVLALVGSLALSGPAYGAGSQPFELVRALQFMQENIALGSQASQQAQQKLLLRMTEEYMSADAAVWQDRKNFAAAIIHALSGGDPVVLRTLIANGVIGADDLPLARGALAYAEGRSAEAADLLRPIDAATLEPSLAGYLALTQSSLTIETDPKRAGHLLDLARLMMPGTLVEEASLRREVTAVVQDGDIEKFERLARQQLTRFNRSLFATQFRHQFAEALIRLDYGAGAARLPMIADILAGMAPADQREIYLIIAQRALTAGKTVIARFAADRAATLATGADADEVRAQLYAAAALIVTDDFDEALKRLKAIDARSLNGEDAKLLESALVVAARLRQWPQPQAFPPRMPEHLTTREPNHDKDAETIAALTERVAAALARTDEFLKESAQ